MKKNLLLCLIIALPVVATAEKNSPTPTESKGIHIVPLSEQRVPIQFKNQILNHANEVKENGFKEMDGNVAYYLLNIDKIAPQAIQNAKTQKTDAPYDNRLKESLPELKNLSFPFKGIAGIYKQDVIGFAAIGAYEKNGWNGVRELFKASPIGNCSYSKIKILGAELSEETTQYIVNKKPSHKLIQGNKEEGFLYTVTWYTDDSMSMLECANKKYDQKIMSKIVNMANNIDKVGSL